MNSNNDLVIINPQVKDLPKFTPKLNLGVLASGNGSNFESLVKISNQENSRIKIQLLIVCA